MHTTEMDHYQHAVQSAEAGLVVQIYLWLRIKE